MKTKIILASGSPRRRELLSQIGLDYQVVVSDASEVTSATEPKEICRELACLKARDVAEKMLKAGCSGLKDAAASVGMPSTPQAVCPAGEEGSREVQAACPAGEEGSREVQAACPAGGSGQTSLPSITLVIGSDTIVAADGKILGKPADAEDARRMLRIISGREHQVCTGVCAVEISGGRIVSEESFADVTDVFISNLTEEDISWYLSTGEPFDKAGAYGIQGYFARFVEKIDGDYNTVVGLPAGRLWREIIRKYE